MNWTKLLMYKLGPLNVSNGGSRISQAEEYLTYYLVKFLQNCMNMKEIA